MNKNLMTLMYKHAASIVQVKVHVFGFVTKSQGFRKKSTIKS